MTGREHGQVERSKVIRLPESMVEQMKLVAAMKQSTPGAVLAEAWNEREGVPGASR